MTAKKTTAPRDRAGSGKTPKRKRVDWEALEIAYRTGKFSLRQLGDKFGPNASSISRRAERDGWTKDLSDAIRQATAAKLVSASALEAAVEKGATAAATAVQQNSQNATASVAAVAELNAKVVLRHRVRVEQATDVAMRMLSELDATTTKAGEIEALFDVLTDELDARGKAAAQQQLREFMKLHSRVGSVQKLVDALGKAQVLERQAFGLDDATKTPDKPAPLDWASIPESERMGAYLRMVNGQ